MRLIMGDSDATRTHDRLLRRQMLYPAELPNPGFRGAKVGNFGNDCKISEQFS